MKEGDIYHWSFKRPKDFMPYHCCSQIAIFKGRSLTDTYWNTSGGRHWTPEQAESELELTFVANFADLERADAYSVRDYYDPKDIVDLRHANNGDRDNVYIRRGAKRSADTMRETLLYTIERSESQARMAQARIERCRASLAKIDAGELDGYYIDSARGER